MSCGNKESRINSADAIREFIVDVAELPEVNDFNGDTSLFLNNLLDSMNLVALIAFIEETFGIKVKPMDIVYENFDTQNLILSYIERKKAGNV